MSANKFPVELAVTDGRHLFALRRAWSVIQQICADGALENIKAEEAQFSFRPGSVSKSLSVRLPFATARVYLGDTFDIEVKPESSAPFIVGIPYHGLFDTKRAGGRLLFGNETAFDHKSPSLRRGRSRNPVAHLQRFAEAMAAHQGHEIQYVEDGRALISSPVQSSNWWLHKHLAIMLHMHALTSADHGANLLPADRAYAEISAPFMLNCINHDMFNNAGRVPSSLGTMLNEDLADVLFPALQVVTSRPLIRGSNKPDYIWRFDLRPNKLTSTAITHWKRAPLELSSYDYQQALQLAVELGISSPPFELRQAA